MSLRRMTKNDKRSFYKNLIEKPMNGTERHERNEKR